MEVPSEFRPAFKRQPMLTVRMPKSLYDRLKHVSEISGIPMNGIALAGCEAQCDELESRNVEASTRMSSASAPYTICRQCRGKGTIKTMEWPIIGPRKVMIDVRCGWCGGQGNMSPEDLEAWRELQREISLVKESK